MPKFGILRDHLVDIGLAQPADFHRPEPATDAQLHTVHDAAYVAAFCNGTLGRDAMRRIGFPWAPGLVDRTRTAAGGALLAARLALDPANPTGIACNTAGGTHHAHRDFGSGFCILNDLAVAAAVLVEEDAVDQVLILDCDVHQGDGTATIFARQPRVFTCSVHCGVNFPARKPPSDLDVDVPEFIDDDGYDAILRGDTPLFRGVDWLLEQVEPDLVLYDAGVDVHADDRLGRLSLTDDGITRRDTRVLEACRAHGVPVACVIGGGYDADHHRLAARHALLHRAAFDVAARA